MFPFHDVVMIVFIPVYKVGHLAIGMQYVCIYIHIYIDTYMHASICRMMTSSNGNIFRVTGPLCGEFTGPGEFPTQRPVTRSFDIFFDLRLNKRSSKQW